MVPADRRNEIGVSMNKKAIYAILAAIFVIAVAATIALLAANNQARNEQAAKDAGLTSEEQALVDKIHAMTGK